MKKRLVGLVFFMAIFIAISLANLTSAADFSPKEIVLPELPPAPQTLPEDKNIPPLALSDVPELECPNDLNYSFPDDGYDGQFTDCKISGNLDLIPGDYNVKTIVMIANNSIFDCHGARLDGSATYAATSIWVWGSNNTIKNCNIDDYNTGIFSGRGYNTSISRNNTIFNNSINAGYGIKIFGWESNFSHNVIRASIAGIFSPDASMLVRNNYIGFNDISLPFVTADGWGALPPIGMRLWKMVGTRIVNNTIANTQIGTDLWSVGNITFEGNTFYNNSNHSIYFGRSSGAVGTSRDINLTNNYFELSQTGYVGSYDNGSFFSGNKFIETYYGIYLGEAKSPIIENNYFEENYIGVANHPYYSFYNASIHSNIFKSNGAGIYFSGLYQVSDTAYEVFDNVFDSNFHGLYIEDARYNYTKPYKTTYNFYNNTLKNNRNCGIYANTTEKRSVLNIYGDEIYGSEGGICLLNGWEHFISHNNIHDNTNGIHILTEDPSKIFLNRIYSNDGYQVYGESPREVSYGNYGNYWGHTEEPCFVEGQDSSRTDIIDNYPLCDSPPDNHQLIILPSYGWYFVGFNIFPENPHPSEVFKSLIGNYELVKYYFGGEPKIYNPSSPFNTLNSIEPWYGYWVKYTKWGESGLIALGSKVTGCNNLSLSSSPAQDYWIGYWLEDEKEIGEVLSSIEGNYEWVRTYNSENQQWESYLPGLPQFSDLTRMKPGQGYLIKMTNEDEIDYC